MRSTVLGMVVLGGVALAPLSQSHSPIAPVNDFGSLGISNQTIVSATFSTDGKVTGTSTTYFTPAAIAAAQLDSTNKPQNPFFKSLGTNGRACVSCHDPTAGWTITPALVQSEMGSFDPSNMATLHPIFRPNDGSNVSNIDNNVACKTIIGCKAAYSQLLNYGLIRVGIPIPSNAEFTLTRLASSFDPDTDVSHYNPSPSGTTPGKALSLFRRPLPSTNLAFLSTVMWDGRETWREADGSLKSIAFDLGSQANGATIGHAQALSPLSDSEREAIVAFESGLYSAQSFSLVPISTPPGLLGSGAGGGPVSLSLLSPANQKTASSPSLMTLYSASWIGSNAGRAAVVRGQSLFSSRTFDIRGVSGLNDSQKASNIVGTCATCHDISNAPNQTNAPRELRMIDMGISKPSRAPIAHLPIYTFTQKSTGLSISTSDPGRALITGKWADMNKFQEPILRNLAARPPYFHNGTAQNLMDVVAYYNARFNIGLSDSEASDLVSFLMTL